MNPSENPLPASSSNELFDYKLLRHWIGFVWGGFRRHRVLAVAVLAATIAFTALALAIFPRVFKVQSKILAQRNLVMSSLGNPRRAIPYDADAPTRAAQETVIRRDNLVSLVKQTNLIDQWEATRAPVLKVKDAVLNLLRGELSEEDKLDSMVGTLEKKLKVEAVGSEGTVTITIEWPNAQMAYQLVEAATQNFLEARHVSEVSAIAESISILEVHASSVRNSMDQALNEVEAQREAKRKGVKRQVATLSGAPGGEVAQPESGGGENAPAPVARPNRALEQELTQLKFLIRAKRRAIADLEEFRNRRLSELNAQLAEQRVVYADQHPVVVDTKQRIASLQRTSPQVQALKHDEAQLMDEYQRKGGRDPESMVEPSTALRRTDAAEAAVFSEAVLGEDPNIEHARAQLRMATATYEDLLMRIDAARIELDTARAAFKYRYSVINPPQVPKKPEKPNPVVFGVAGLLGGLFLALFAGATLDLWRGRVVERWQVEQSLGLPVLAEVVEP